MDRDALPDVLDYRADLEVSVMGEALSSGVLELSMAVAVTVGLGAFTALLARRMQAQLAGA